MHIWISVSTKLQVKLTNLNICTKFAQKRYFPLETEEVNIPIEFCIFELVRVPNFRLNWLIWIFRQSLPKKVFPVENRKSEHPHRILHFWISLSTKFRVKLRSLIFCTKFAQKGVSRWKQKKWTSPLNSAYLN